AVQPSSSSTVPMVGFLFRGRLVRFTQVIRRERSAGYLGRCGERINAMKRRDNRGLFAALKVALFLVGSKANPAQRSGSRMNLRHHGGGEGGAAARQNDRWYGHMEKGKRASPQRVANLPVYTRDERRGLQERGLERGEAR
ncbi:MAG: hypothetical protein ABIR80_01310, partial [Opitutaceae bacterium]